MSKLKTSALKDTTKKIKNQIIDWEIYSQYFYLTKDMYWERIKNSHNTGIRRQPNQLAKDLNKSSSYISMTNMQNKKHLPILIVLGKQKISKEWNANTHLLELTKTVTIPSVGEDMQL